MSHESDTVLAEIRAKADKAAKLNLAYERQRERTREAKAAWEAAEDELRELCRSWETSEEVGSRPMIAAIEQAESDGDGEAPVRRRKARAGAEEAGNG